MTGLTIAVRRASHLPRIWFPQRALARCGAAFLALVPAGAVWAWRDPRLVNGEAAALKPTRFALSIGVYLLTASAMFTRVRPERRSALPARASTWMMLMGSTVELSCITLQAARAKRSHFNRATPADAAILAAMGAFAVLFVGGALPLAWEIGRRPDREGDPVMDQAIIAGLLMTCVVGGGTGGLMSAKGRHSQGRDGRRLPLLGWSLTGGDMRPSHFLGIHAMQALPVIAACSNAFGPRRAKPVFAVGAVAYGLVTVALLQRALSRKPARY